MKAKLHKHEVSINDKRRQNKRSSDVLKKAGKGKNVQSVFDAYYKDQVRALYKAVEGE
ncbi:MAG: hypothetical protein P9L88_02225 [Candidatus Tantalella remota]|nr:hypothetical protein [Candidatus Tantalella remota]